MIFFSEGAFCFGGGTEWVWWLNIVGVKEGSVFGVVFGGGG